MMAMNEQIGERWEITVDGRPRTYDHNKSLAMEAAEYLKRKYPTLEVAVRDLEGVEPTLIVPEQKTRMRN
jgi:hypothetical protein